MSKAKAIRAYNEDRYEDALRLFDTYLKKNPKDAEALRGRACTKMKLEKLQEALEDVDKALGLEPNEPEGLRIRADIKFKLGDVEGARRDYEILHRLKPTQFTFGILGELKRIAGDIEGAIRYFDVALTLKQEQEAWVYAKRGEAKRQLARLYEAQRDLDKSLELNPFQTDALVSRGQIYAANQAVLYALYDFTHVLQIDAKNELAVREKQKITHQLALMPEKISLLPAGHRCYVQDVVVWPDGTMATAADNELKFWDKAGQCVATKLTRSRIISLAAWADGSLAAAEEYGHIYIYDKQKKLIHIFNKNPIGRLYLKGLAILTDQTLLIAYWNGTFEIWTKANNWFFSNRLKIFQLNGLNENLHGFELMPNGKLVISCGRRNALKVFDLEGKFSTGSFDIGASSFGITPEGLLIFVGYKDPREHSESYKLQFYNTNTGRFLNPIILSSYINHLAALPNGSIVTVESADNPKNSLYFSIIKLWDKEQSLIFIKTMPSINNIKALPDGRLALFHEKRVAIWEISELQKLAQLEQREKEAERREAQRKQLLLKREQLEQERIENERQEKLERERKEQERRERQEREKKAREKEERERRERQERERQQREREEHERMEQQKRDALYKEYLEKAEKKQKDKNLKAAIKYYDQAIELKANDPDLIIKRGQVKKQSKDFNGAIEDFEKALKLKPNYPAAMAAIVETKKQQEDELRRQKIEQEMKQRKEEEESRRKVEEEEKIKDLVNSLGKLRAAYKGKNPNVPQIHKEFQELERTAMLLRFTAFYVTRGDFYHFCAKNEKTPIRQTELFKKALADYRRALDLDPFIQDIPKKIEAIEKLLKPTKGVGTFFVDPEVTQKAKPLTRADLTPEQLKKLQQKKEELRKKL
jgi:tetratricopeptide (TPR) repeat protein